jgi:Na+/proline symporter
MENPAMILIALSGWVVYRFRQTRALTMAQFFEIRYSRRFRVFAGLVAFLSGIINYGIFPAVAARFFIALCGLPVLTTVGPWEIPTFALLMAVMLVTALFFVFLGGQVAVIVTDFLQGTFGQLVFLAVMLFLLATYSWSEIGETLLAAPEGQSMVNPFDLGQAADFNAFYWVISVVVLFYGMLGRQGTSGYNAAAIDAHEAKMANILNGWRFRVLLLITLVLPICIRVVMTGSDHASDAAAIEAIIAAQPLGGADPEVFAAEIRTPAAASVMLPSGLLGLFAAALLGAFISTNDTYLHSWGSIFIQDVVLPFRKRPLSPRVHLWLLRASILGVAIFAFLFSLYYTPNQYVAMFLALTGAIFVGGAGSAIIGGLYWRRGTTAGAWTAMIAGMTLAGGGVIVKQIPATLVHPGETVTFLSGSIENGRVDVVIPADAGAGTSLDVPGAGIRMRIDDFAADDGDLAATAAIAIVDPVDERELGRFRVVADGSTMTGVGADGMALSCELRGGAVGLAGVALRSIGVIRDLNGQILTFCSIALSIFLYIAVSLCTCRVPFDLDRMLHRESRDRRSDDEPRARWWERLGFGQEMTRWDRIVTAVTISWPIFFTLVFIAGMLRHLLAGPLGLEPISDAAWLEAWGWWLWCAIGTAMVVTVWFTIGGLRDLVRMFRLMGRVQADELDDGRVIDHRNADEIPGPTETTGMDDHA